MESIDITEMTDFRHINDVCFTQLAAQQQQQQQSQINTQGALNTSFHSCATDNFQGSMLKEQQPHQQSEQQNPLLQSLIDYTHSLTTPPTTTIGNNYGDGTAAVAATASVCNARAGEVETGNLSMDGVHFDEHDIYYVSPTKRKSSLRATLLKQQQIQQQQYERFKTKSPLRSNTTTAAINCKQTRIATNTAYGSRLAGIVHDFSLDETSSHYSDTALQVLRSGSISGGSLFGETQRHFALTNNNNNSNNNNNNHCYSHSHSSSNSSLVTNSERFQRSSSNNNNNNNNNNLVTNKQSAHRGSLQRFKGRSTQSLCSCDAGIEAEIDMQSTRPLYQYDVDGKMAHTYTCEQNAQILMRLARERQRKLSLGAEIGLKDSYDGSTITLSKGRTKTEKQKMQYYADDIPPIPPPPTLKRQTNSSFKQKVIERNCNSRSSTLETLCSNDVGSLLEDCTASILKCANTISNELSTGKTDPNGMNAKLADTCPTGRASTNYLAQPLSIDDIFMPRTHRPADLSLCFLHTKANSLGIGMGMGMGMENTLMRSAGLKTASNLVKDNRSLYKYNTIGPSNSSEFAKQLAHYRDQQKLEQKHEREEQVLQVAANRCRCFSKSLSSFQYDNKLIDSADNQLCYQGSSYSNLNRNDDSGGRHCPTTKNNRLQFPITTTSTDTSANILNDGAFVSLHDSSNTNSGLNHHQQHQYHHEHHYPHQDYLLHNHKPSITSAALHNQLLSTKVQQQQKQKQKHQLDIGTQHQHPHLQTNVTNLMPWKHRQCPSRCSSSSGTNSLRFDAAKHWLAVSSILLIIGAASVAVPLALRVAASAPFEERLRVAQQLLDQVPLIDGHNDLPWNIRKFLHNKLNDFNFDQDLRNVMPWAKSSWSHTDLQRLKKGRVSAQFWAAYVPCEAQHRDAVQLTLEQIDVIKRLTDRYYPQLVWCTTSADIIEAHKKHQMCSLTGVEGGHSIGGSLAVMRTLYAIGVRYMTLTSTCHTPWADSSAADAPTFNVKHGGLTIFGKTIIREMNRLGMMVDLSHVSKGTMHDAIEVSEAPVIFSHSSAYALCNSSRNVQDDTLQSLAKNGGIVMVNFYSKFLSCNENATVHDAVAHINHIRRIAGVDHVGLGAGFDGINFTPKGLEDVSTYPTLFAELVGAGWNVEDLTKLAGGNFLRVMKQVEKIRDEKRKLGITPYEDEPSFRTDNPYNCTTTS